MKRAILRFVISSLILLLAFGCRKDEPDRQKPAVSETQTTAEIAGQPTELTDKILQPLAGEFGSSAHWGSGWIDLATPTDFARGDRLRLTIGGTAEKILVRLLPKGQSPDLSGGIIGGEIIVPRNRTVEVLLPTDRREIIQISVHGGPNPWGRYPLGGNNGPATLEAAELIPK